jgi:dUTP pyrophosphatase
MEIKIKKLVESAIIPTKATPGANAYDVAVPNDTLIRHGRNIAPLEIAIELPQGYEAKIEPRSGISVKGMPGVLNGQYKSRLNADVIQGKIDSDYRGCIGVIIKSDEPTEFVIEAGTRIAQMTIYKTEEANFTLTDELSSTQRGKGGFGHTGTSVN